MSILTKIGDLLGGNLIKDAAAVVDKFVTTPAEKAEALAAIEKMRNDYQAAVRALENEDRASARTREVETAKAGRKNALMTITGIVGLASYVAIICAALFLDVKDKELYYFLAGNAFGLAASIFQYYFGSSHGSTQKQESLERALKNVGKN